jgi:NhaC family Na+:H+ antiporter
VSESTTTRLPSLWESSVSVLSLVLGIGISVAVYGLDPQIPTLLGVGVSALVAWRCGYRWAEIEAAMVQGVTRAVPALMIFLLIGILIGVWIVSGVVPTMLYYGMLVLSPDIFLPSTLIICAIASLATGSSWGTSGTIGVALMGVGGGLGFPLPVVAGAVISGAYFGDKMSPLSDTTNLASSMAGTDLYTHIRHMAKTTGIAFGLTLIISVVQGASYTSDATALADVAAMLAVLGEHFLISPLMLLPPAVLIFVSFRKIPPLPGIALGILVAALIGFTVQGVSFEQMMTVAFSGFVSGSGIDSIDELLSRGGMSSMSYTITIVLVAMMFGGIMEKTNQLKVLVATLLEKADSTGSLVAAAVFTTFAANLVLCEQYMSVIVGARAYAREFEARGLHAKNLSRIVEDSGTVTACLIPWTSGGAYQAGVLGVATLAYAPFAFFCWLSPLVTLAFGFLGFDIARIEDDPDSHISIQD